MLLLRLCIAPIENSQGRAFWREFAFRIPSSANAISGKYLCVRVSVVIKRSSPAAYRIASGNRFAPPLAKPIRSILSRSYFAHMSERTHSENWQTGETPKESHLFRYSDKRVTDRNRSDSRDG